MTKKKAKRTTDEVVEDVEVNELVGKTKSKGKKKVNFIEAENESRISNVAETVEKRTQIETHGKGSKRKRIPSCNANETKGKTKAKANETEETDMEDEESSSEISYRKRKEVDGHGSPAPLYEMIGLLTASQKKDVEDIGFGGLLELKAKAFYHCMIDWLMTNYDHNSQMFLYSERNQFVITKDDVYDVFMLPCTDNPVKLTSNKKKDNPDTELVTLWRREFNVEGNGELSLDKVKVKMLDLGEGGEEFKKLFVLYAMGTFLAPIVHKRVDLRLVTAVEDVAEILQQDWCSYVLDRLNFAVKSWKINESKSIGGCLLFLQIIYFHRLTWKGTPAKSDLPLLQHWTYEGLKARMLEEMESYKMLEGCFGLGTWDHTTYPVSRNQPKLLYRQSIKEATTSEDPTSRCLIIPIPADILTNEELRQKYPDVRVRKWMTTKRNLQLVARIHSEMKSDPAAQEEGPVETEALLTTTGDDIVQPSQFSWTQALKEPDFAAEFDALGKKVDEIIATQVIQPPSFDLGLGVEDVGRENESRPSKIVVTNKKVGREPKVTLRYTRATSRKGAQKK